MSSIKSNDVQPGQHPSLIPETPLLAASVPGDETADKIADILSKLSIRIEPSAGMDRVADMGRAAISALREIEQLVNSNPSIASLERSHSVMDTSFREPSVRDGPIRQPKSEGTQNPSNSKNHVANISNARNPHFGNHELRGHGRNRAAQNTSYNVHSDGQRQRNFLHRTCTEQAQTIYKQRQQNALLDEQLKTLKVNILTALVSSPKESEEICNLGNRDKIMYWEGRLKKIEEEQTSFCDILWEATEPLREAMLMRGDGDHGPQPINDRSSDAWHDAVINYVRGYDEGYMKAKEDIEARDEQDTSAEVDESSKKLTKNSHDHEAPKVSDDGKEVTGNGQEEVKKGI